MNYFQEIQLIQDNDFSSALLLSALYNKLHRALVSLNNNEIGISFPDYQEKKTLGGRIRLHSTIESLKKLGKINWLTGMYDHVKARGIDKVPDEVTYAKFFRVQSTSVLNMRRRQKKRHGYSDQELIKRIPDSVKKNILEPFVRLSSTSTAQKFCMHVKKELFVDFSAGKFNQYGLSKVATVPLF